MTYDGQFTLTTKKNHWSNVRSLGCTVAHTQIDQIAEQCCMVSYRKCIRLAANYLWLAARTPPAKAVSLKCSLGPKQYDHLYVSLNNPVVQRW